ncbi:MAG: hypothetical protein JNK48_16770 [Bryobacterales bacterium]|nr:hypothetical protein [Bryobacterales bacterium]
MKIVTLVISLMLTPANCQTKGEGIILGQVMVTGKTTAPSGVAVIATRIRAISRDGWGKLVASGMLYSGATSTNVKGEFVIENLPVGRYYVCALGKPPNWIGTCEWNRPPSVVNVVAGAPASVELGLNEGEALRVAVMSPRGRIAESTRFGLGIIITGDGYCKHAGVPTISGP